MNNEPLDHHFKVGHPRHINKHTRFTSWPYRQFTNPCNQSHGGNDIGLTSEPKYKH